MSVDAPALSNYQADNAGHQAFATAFHNMLVAAGLVQTADTGQATLATLVRPAVNTVSGYEIFRFNDTEQATLPVFLRVEYASGSPQTNPAIRLNVGTSTNGAGVLTGATSNSAFFNQWSGAADVPGATKAAFASVANGHCVIGYGQDSPGARGSIYVVERPKNVDGSRTTDGLAFWSKGWQSGVATFGFAILRAGSGLSIVPATTQDNQPIISFFGGHDDVVGAEFGLYPAPLAVNGNMRWSSLLSYRSGSIGYAAEQSINIFGVARNYRILGSVWAINSAGFAVPYY